MSTTVITLIILAAGLIVVVGGVLVLRLHAFLALVLGALVVGICTPTTSVYRYAVERDSSVVDAVDEPDGTVTVRPGGEKSLKSGEWHRVLVPNDSNWEDVGAIRVGALNGAHVVVQLEDDLQWDQLKAGVRIARPDVLRTAKSLSTQTVGERVAAGFGQTCAGIGILIAMAAIIGKCLLDSGAADRIVRSALRFLGEPRAPLAFMGSGFLLGIPVFFDTVFYLMIPLGKALRMRTGRNYLLYVLTIVTGATMAHSLVPPTPGPLFVAESMGVDLGVMILGGGVVGLACSVFGYFYAQFANRRWDLPLRPSADFSLADLEAVSQRDDSELPPLWMAVAPIVLPVVFIATHAILKQFSIGDGWIMRTSATLGNKNIALTVSAILSMAMLIRQKKSSLHELSSSVQDALASGGVIILITAGGGAFGRVLQQTGVASLIGELPQDQPWVTVCLAFLITTAIRTAQGSATVAMITSAGIFAGHAAANLGFDPIYLALAIGCGSKPIGWMNDSGFWVIAKMSGMTEKEALKYVTPMTSMMGVVGLIVVVTAVQMFPNW